MSRKLAQSSVSHITYTVLAGT